MLRALLCFLGGACWLFGNWIYRPSLPSLGYIEIAPSIPVQVVGMFGDRYLAANIGVLRSIVVGGGALPDYALEAITQVQVDAAWMNPAHEDNYYTASAVLPWEGYVEEGQFILEEAVKVRRDILPPFFLAFNYYYFFGDVDLATDALENAYRMADEPGARDFFSSLAIRWRAGDDDVERSANLMRKITGTSRNQRVNKFVDSRIKRLEGLGVLRKASAAFTRDRGGAPLSVEDLIGTGYLQSVPDDPTGIGYEILNGRVIMAKRSKDLRLLNREVR